MKKITLRFKKDGTVEKDVDGFKGQGCVTETEFLDQALGSTIKHEAKYEYHIPEMEGTTQTQVLL